MKSGILTSFGAMYIISPTTYQLNIQQLKKRKQQAKAIETRKTATQQHAFFLPGNLSPCLNQYKRPRSI